MVDTSAVVAVVLGESDAEQFAATMSMNAGDVSISAPTYVEAMIVVEARQGPEAASDFQQLLATTGTHIADFDAEQAELAFSAWRRFGKGRHPASLNFGDCFAYALAKQTGSALLFKGNDFDQTDIARAG